MMLAQRSPFISTFCSVTALLRISKTLRLSSGITSDRTSREPRKATREDLLEAEPALTSWPDRLRYPHVSASFQHAPHQAASTKTTVENFGRQRARGLRHDAVSGPQEQALQFSRLRRLWGQPHPALTIEQAVLKTRLAFKTFAGASRCPVHKGRIASL